MELKYLKEKFQTIDDAIKKAEEVGGKDIRLGSMLSSYLVVFISGTYEDTIEELFIKRAGKSGDGEIKNLVESLIDKQFRNPKYDSIKTLMGYLRPDYKKQLETKIKDKNIQALNSIVTNKNKVAHGEISNATIDDIKGWHRDAIKIFEVLENILRTEPGLSPIL